MPLKTRQFMVMCLFSGIALATYSHFTGFTISLKLMVAILSRCPTITWVLHTTKWLSMVQNQNEAVHITPRPDSNQLPSWCSQLTKRSYKSTSGWCRDYTKKKKGCCQPIFFHPATSCSRNNCPNCIISSWSNGSIGKFLMLSSCIILIHAMSILLSLK